MHPTLKLAACLLLTAAPLAAQQDRLKVTLAKLDASSVKFTSAEARVQRVAFNAAVKMSDEPENGAFYVQREKTGPQMGLTVEGQHASIIEYKSGTLRQFHPGACVQSVTRAGIDTYLTLGFGGSGKDLNNKWIIADLGPESINGVQTEKLDLTPKDPAVAKTFKKITLWVDLDQDVTLKQIFYAAATGDYNTATYSNIRYNKPVDLKPFAINGKPCKQ